MDWDDWEWEDDSEGCSGKKEGRKVGLNLVRTKLRFTLQKAGQDDEVMSCAVNGESGPVFGGHL